MYQNGLLKCDMTGDCQSQVTHIDHKGYVYCQHHGNARKLYARCRKLKPSELKLLVAGQPIKKY